MAAHTITTTRDHKSGWFRATCSCGGYRSRLHGFPGIAEQAGLAHKKAKEVQS